MKPRPTVTLAFFAVLAAGGVALALEWRQTRELRNEVKSARGRTAEFAQVRAENHRLRGQQISEDELAALRGDHAALPRLRAELAALTPRVRAGAPVAASAGTGAAIGNRSSGDAPAVLVLGTRDTSAGEVAWRTETMSVSVNRDGRLGQHLLLEQKLRSGEIGWSTMKLNLPERWSIESVDIRDGAVRITVAGGGTYTFNYDVMKTLSRALAEVGAAANDDALVEAWKRHAGR